MGKKLKIIFVVVIILLIICIIIYNIFDVGSIILRKLYPKKYEDYVQKYSRENNIEALLVYSIIKAESNFKDTAESSSGAKGLMQIMDSTAEEIQSKLDNNDEQKIDLFEPEINIKYGTMYFSYLLEHYNQNQAIALAAYNAGMGNVDKWIQDGVISSDGRDIEKIPYKETNMYVRKIINNYKIYKKIYKER